MTYEQRSSNLYGDNNAISGQRTSGNDFILPPPPPPPVLYDPRTSLQIVDQRNSNSFVQYDPRATVMSRTSNNYNDPQYVQTNRLTNNSNL